MELEHEIFQIFQFLLHLSTIQPKANFGLSIYLKEYTTNLHNKREFERKIFRIFNFLTFINYSATRSTLGH